MTNLSATTTRCEKCGLECPKTATASVGSGGRSGTEQHTGYQRNPGHSLNPHLTGATTGVQRPKGEKVQCLLRAFTHTFFSIKQNVLLNVRIQNFIRRMHLWLN
jgi:hypothetical protein